ncbi:MAG TPA: FAD/NAD(P)-binding protein, partial [Roseiarcus sp.]
MRPLRLVVVGGGFTGAALIIHAARAATAPLEIDVVEPNSELGRGIAYGTPDPAHRINVPSDRMSLFSDDRSHLTRWLQESGRLPDAASTDSRGHHYVARGAFGDYVLDTLTRTIAESDLRHGLRHHRARAVAIHPDGRGWLVELSSGARLTADKVALCIGHSSPSLPCPVSPAALRHSGLVRNPWAPHAMAAIGAHDSVLVVGTGLTMADVVATLSDAGHHGQITAISRRGLLARPHGVFLDGVDILEGEPAPDTAIGLLRLARRRIRQYGERFGWQPVVDGLRSKLREVWRALPPREQRRVAQRLLPFWEVHRFRIAPQLHELVEDWRRRGRLVVQQAGLASLDAGQGKLIATLRRRGAAPAAQSFDAVVVCVGPGRKVEREPLIGQLVDRGLGKLDEVGTGLAVDLESRLLTRDGAAHPDLLAFGPLTRGSFGEMTGAPDIARQIERC